MPIKIFYLKKKKGRRGDIKKNLLSVLPSFFFFLSQIEKWVSVRRRNKEIFTTPIIDFAKKCSQEKENN